MTLGLFIGRLNPPHIWHIQIIKRALKENKKVLLLLWTPFETDEKNPLNFYSRKNLLQKIFKEKNLYFLELNDTNSDLVWIQNIIKILKKDFEEFEKINFYLWDFENDSAIKVFKEFEEELKYHKIEYILNSRENSFIHFESEKYFISATNMRKALKNKNYELASKFSDNRIFEEIRKYLN